MKLSPTLFMAQIIRPALAALALGGAAAEELLLGTALQESGLRNERQEGGGPALGYFQMEPATHDDIWANFLAYHPDLARRVRGLLPQGVAASADQLIPCPVYAAAMARLSYYRHPDPLPPAGDLAAQAAYYKRLYNTPLGKGSVAQYEANWRQAMGDGTGGSAA